MKLLNVRLTEDDEQLVRKLRSRKINISKVVRTALRAELERVKGTRTRRDAAALLARIDAQHPVSDDDRRRTIDTRNRAEVRAHIRDRLARRVPR